MTESWTASQWLSCKIIINTWLVLSSQLRNCWCDAQNYGSGYVLPWLHQEFVPLKCNWVSFVELIGTETSWQQRKSIFYLYLFLFLWSWPGYVISDFACSHNVTLISGCALLAEDPSTMWMRSRNIIDLKCLKRNKSIFSQLNKHCFLTVERWRKNFTMIIYWFKSKMVLTLRKVISLLV